MIDHDALRRTFERYARAVLTSFTIEEVLYPLTDQIVEVMGVDGAGLCLLDEGHLAFVTATDESVARLDQAQVAIDAVADRAERLGDAAPCYAVLEVGAPLATADIAELERWPVFVESMEAAGFAAHLAVPLPSTGVRMGVLSVYHAAPRSWTDEELRIAQLLADLAAGYVQNAETLVASRRTNEQLERALDSRVVIEQAKGIMAERYGLTPAEAFGRLRRHARDHRQPLHVVARELIERSGAS